VFHCHLFNIIINLKSDFQSRVVKKLNEILTSDSLFMSKEIQKMQEYQNNLQTQFQTMINDFKKQVQQTFVSSKANMTMLHHQTSSATTTTSTTENNITNEYAEYVSYYENILQSLQSQQTTLVNQSKQLYSQILSLKSENSSLSLEQEKKILLIQSEYVKQFQQLKEEMQEQLLQKDQHIHHLNQNIVTLQRYNLNLKNISFSYLVICLFVYLFHF
jgi:hypothetical protein